MTENDYSIYSDKHPYSKKHPLPGFEIKFENKITIHTI